MEQSLMNNTQCSPGTIKIRVWDSPIRIFHWTLVLLFVSSWISAEIGGNAMQYHMWSGYAVMTLVLFRVFWGLMGSETARFKHFIRGPATVLAYARAWMKPGYRAPLGHNPLGGWSVAGLLLALAFQTVTGMFSNDDITTEGPLYHLVSKDTSNLISNLHSGGFNVLLALVALHIVAIILYYFKHRENLVKPMLTGLRLMDLNTEQPKLTSRWLALLLLLIALGIVYGVVTKL